MKVNDEKQFENKLRENKEKINLVLIESCTKLSLITKALTKIT